MRMRRRCSPMTVVSGNVRFTQIFRCRLSFVAVVGYTTELFEMIASAGLVRQLYFSCELVTLYDNWY